MAETKAVQRKADMLPAPIVSLVQALVPDCNALLPPDITTEQFRAALWLELTGRPALHACYVESLRECVVKAAMYGMLPGRDCAFLPFGEKTRKEKKATFIPYYAGILRGLYRTGMIDNAFAEIVYSHDEFDLDYGRPQILIHKPPRKDRGVAEGAYSFLLMKGSSRPQVHYMDPDDLERVRRTAPAHDQGPWVTHPNEMKRKTALKNGAKYVQLTPQMLQMLEEDDARQLEDIPPERHRQNIVDLFGDTHGLPNDLNFAREGGTVETPTTTTTPLTPKKPEPAGEPASGQKQPTPKDARWKITLHEHREALGQMAVSGVYDEDARERLTSLVERVDFALSPLGGVKDPEGFDLAAAVLEWIEMPIS